MGIGSVDAVVAAGLEDSWAGSGYLYWWGRGVGGETDGDVGSVESADDVAELTEAAYVPPGSKSGLGEDGHGDEADVGSSYEGHTPALYPSRLPAGAATVVALDVGSAVCKRSWLSECLTPYDDLAFPPYRTDSAYACERTPLRYIDIWDDVGWGAVARLVMAVGK